MTIKELIEELQQYPKDLPVYIYSNNSDDEEINHSDIAYLEDESPYVYLTSNFL